MAEQLMTLAYENGINLFDTAEVYAAGKWVNPVPEISKQWAVRPNITKLLICAPGRLVTDVWACQVQQANVQEIREEGNTMLPHLDSW